MEERREGFGSWPFVITIGAIAVAAVALLGIPALLSGPATTPAPSEATLAVVVTDQGRFGFERDGPDLVVTSLEPTVTELGRATVPTNSASANFLFCPAKDGGQPIRILFGHLLGLDGRYAGPSAVGQFTPVGLYLYVLAPATFDATAEISIRTGASQIGVDAGGFEGLEGNGKAQSSGCFVG
jgi:hypothetical protein